jgi:broad specificity phosphatase PhoE
MFSSKIVEKEKGDRIESPFPKGESYEHTTQRMKRFLDDLLKKYDNKKVMIIGHRATQYGLEHLISGKPLKEAVTDKWHWQPGWEYKLENK